MISNSNIWKAKAVYSWWCVVMIDDELEGSETPQENLRILKGTQVILKMTFKVCKK